MTVLEIKKENNQYVALIANEANGFLSKIVINDGELELFKAIGDSCITRIRDLATEHSYKVEQ